MGAFFIASGSRQLSTPPLIMHLLALIWLVTPALNFRPDWLSLTRLRLRRPSRVPRLLMPSLVGLLALVLRLEPRAVVAPLGRSGRILEDMREAEALARELGDRRRLGLVLADIGARFRNVGDHERAIDSSRQALDIATELADAGLQIEAKYRLAQAHFAMGDLSKATVLFMETVHALADESVVRRAALPAFFAAWPRAWLALAFSRLGRFPQALASAEAAIPSAEGAN